MSVRPPSRMVLLGLMGACSITSTVESRQAGPVIIRDQRTLDTLQLTNFRLSLDIYGQQRTDEVDPETGPTVRDKDTLFRETIELSTEGFIGHPNLIEFNLLGKLRLTQEKVDSQTLSLNERRSDTTLAFSIDALILKQGPAPLTLFARRDQVFFDRQFGASLESKTTEYGARLVLKSDLAPSQIEIFRRIEEQDDRSGAIDFRRDQRTFEWHGEFRRVGGSRLRWDYSFDHIDQSGELLNPTTFDRHDAFFMHLLEFGPTRASTLRSSLRLFKETGISPIDRIRFDENLRLQHTPTFETRIDYRFERQSLASETQVQNRVSTGFRHELFDSLVTRGEAGAQWFRLDEDDFASDEVFANVSTDYTKIVARGRLQMNGAASFSHRDESDRGTSIMIVDEGHLFGVAGVVNLSRRNIVPSSIVVTDGSGFITFLEGLDYMVRTFQDRTELRRILGGNIGLSQAVLVDYQIGPEPGSVTDTTGLGFTIRYTLEEGLLRGLSVYSQYARQDQNRISDVNFVLPESDINDWRFGLDFTRGPLYLKVERQLRDSTLSPFNATRFEGRYLRRFGRESSMSIGAVYQEMDNTSDNIQTTLTQITGRWNHRLTNKLSASLLAIWRDQQDSAGTDSRGFEQRLDLTWQHRQTTIYATVRNATVDTDVNDTLFHTFLIGIRREF